MKNHCYNCDSTHTTEENGTFKCWDCGLIYDYEEGVIVSYPDYDKRDIEMEKFLQGIQNPLIS